MTRQRLSDLAWLAVAAVALLLARLLGGGVLPRWARKRP